MARSQLSDVMTVERYSHVMHLCSNVTGRLQPGKTRLRRPAGVLAGGHAERRAKVRAMEIIDELEPHRRGPYGGAVGYIDFSGNMDTCIALRTMVLQGPDGLSPGGRRHRRRQRPRQRIEETLNKARGLLRALEMAEISYESALSSLELLRAVLCTDERALHEGVSSALSEGIVADLVGSR